MTKAQLKEKYTAWNISIGKLDERKNEIFHELQELCAEKGDGHKWCCLQKLVEELVKTGNAYKALDLMREYYEIEGQQEALRNLATATNNFDI
ncbi:MAG: hypothetical protein NC078_11095 [Ruminococcus sp.]|nr:hypothetical protein [Ruminococcus sp.]